MRSVVEPINVQSSVSSYFAKPKNATSSVAEPKNDSRSFAGLINV